MVRSTALSAVQLVFPSSRASVALCPKWSVPGSEHHRPRRLGDQQPDIIGSAKQLGNQTQRGTPGLKQTALRICTVYIHTLLLRLRNLQLTPARPQRLVDCTSFPHTNIFTPTVTFTTKLVTTAHPNRVYHVKPVRMSVDSEHVVFFDRQSTSSEAIPHQGVRYPRSSLHHRQLPQLQVRRRQEELSCLPRGRLRLPLKPNPTPH